MPRTVTPWESELQTLKREREAEEARERSDRAARNARIAELEARVRHDGM